MEAQQRETESWTKRKVKIPRYLTAKNMIKSGDNPESKIWRRRDKFVSMLYNLIYQVIVPKKDTN